MNLGNRLVAFFEPIITLLLQIFRQVVTQLPCPSPPSTADVVDPEVAAQRLGLEAGHRGVDWATIMVSFCLASATGVALMSIQVQSRELPTDIHVFSLAIVLAVPSFFVSELISSKLEVAGHVLKRLGMFLTATAFFVAITIPFPSYFKIISWFVYAISFLVILVCHCL
ncbi:hypothetical protein I3843_11G093900 [Carya illinoinensis]|nr:hypothetical protein I3843_11G093900 [Carya illinoinensis]